MSRLARLAGAAALGALPLVALGAGPALAAGPTITVTAPADLTVAVPTAVVHFEGRAAMPTGTVNANSITFTVTSPDGHPGAQAAYPHAAAGSVPFAWDFTSTFNGTYHVVIGATGRDGAIDTSPNEPGQWQGDVLIEAKPVPPANVKASKTRSRTVELTWDSNPEPDIIGYQVQRSTAKNQWKPLANTASPAYNDVSTADAGGTYTYRVVAVRQGAAADRVAVSDPSASTSVEVADPPPTTTVASGGTGSGGSTGSGGTGTSGGGSGGSGGSSWTGSGGSTPELARTGKADLSGFTALLEQAQRPGARPAGKTVLPDGTYEEKLPFKQGDEEVGEDGTALGVGIREEGAGAEGRKPIAFLAASLLVTVILMHVLWLKREVDKAPLEPAVATE